MRKFAAVAAMVAAFCVAPVAQAAAHVVGVEVSHAGMVVTVSGKVVGLGNEEMPVDVRTQVHVVCANGQEVGLGLTATLFTERGSEDFEVSSGMLLEVLGCDQVVGLELTSVEVV